jgi:hypothetical protein
MGQKFPAILLNPVHTQKKGVGLHCVARYLFLPWVFVVQCTVQLVECLKGTGNIGGFLLWQKLDQYASFSIPKDSTHGLTGS